MCKYFQKNARKPIKSAAFIVTDWPQFYLCYDSRDTTKISPRWKRTLSLGVHLGAHLVESISLSLPPPTSPGRLYLCLTSVRPALSFWGTPQQLQWGQFLAAPTLPPARPCAASHQAPADRLMDKVGPPEPQQGPLSLGWGFVLSLVAENSPHMDFPITSMPTCFSQPPSTPM